MLSTNAETLNDELFVRLIGDVVDSIFVLFWDGFWGLSANAISWLILLLPSNSKKVVGNLLESKLNKIIDIISINFAL